MLDRAHLFTDNPICNRTRTNVDKILKTQYIPRPRVCRFVSFPISLGRTDKGLSTL